STIAIATFQLLRSASARQAAIIFFTSAEVRHGLVRMVSPVPRDPGRPRACYGSRAVRALSIRCMSMLFVKCRVLMSSLLAVPLVSLAAPGAAQADPREDFLAG